MAKYYNYKKLDDRHAVAFSKPEPNDNLYYYDFDTQKWKPVKPNNRLPYNLCSYYFTDEEFDEEKSIVTSEDSYRLSTGSFPTHDEMLEEKEWRDKIVEKGAELEYCHDNGTVSKAKVAWTKSDIISGVVLCGPIKDPDVNSFGYVYKESEKLCKSGTHLEPLTEEELEKERLEEEAKRKREEFKQIVKYWKESLPYLGIKNQPSIHLYDTRPLYKTLKKYPKCVEMVERSSTWQSCFWAIEGEAKDYDACFIDDEVMVKNGKAYFADYDFLFDIHVHNATYARMLCGDHYPTLLEHREFPMEKVGDTFTFPEITYNNPLFTAVSGSNFTIFTDGNKITYKGGFTKYKLHKVLLSLGHRWTINIIQGRMLLNGHLWTRSISVRLEDIVETEKP